MRERFIRALRHWLRRRSDQARSARVRQRVEQAALGQVTKPKPEPQAYAAAYFLMNPPTWVQRHVETYTLQGLTAARRALTIDVLLPADARAMTAREGRAAVYCLPLVRLNKFQPVPFLDLRDEQGAVVPLRTRVENGALTLEALEHAIRRGANLGASPFPPGLHEALRILVHGDRPLADFGAEWATRELAALAFSDPAVLERIQQVITHLILNSIVWVVLSGAPCEHRVLKISAAIDLGRQRIPAREVVETDREVRGLTIPWTTEGDIDWIETLRTLRAWIAARIGWDSVDITIRDPAIQDPRSYHLQIVPSSGLRVDRIEFDPDRETHELPSIPPIVNRGHFYVRDPALEVKQAIPIAIAVRVARRGYLNVFTASAVLVTALLWCYVAAAKQIEAADDNGAVAAAVLLIVPPFLMLVASRSAESAVTTALLAGVRAGAMTCMLMAAAGAAAITNIRPTATLQGSLRLYAVVSTAACAVVVVAWLGSFAVVRNRADAARCWWCGKEDRRRYAWRLIGGLAAVLTLAEVLLDGGAAEEQPALAGAVVAAIVAVIAVTAAWPERKRIPTGVWLLATFATLAGLAWSASVWWPDTVPPRHTREISEIASGVVAVWAALTGFAVILAPVRPRKRGPRAEGTDANGGEGSNSDAAPTGAGSTVDAAHDSYTGPEVRQRASA